MKILQDAAEAVTYAAEIIRRHVPDPAYRVFLFGSRAEGRSEPSSDIDIGIDGPAPVPREAMAVIAEELDETLTLCTIEVVGVARVSESFRQVARRQIPL